MARIWTWHVGSFLLWLLVVWVGSPAALWGDGGDGEYERIRVVDDRAYPPYAFLDASGEARGITIDIWNLWSERTGIAVEFMLMDWDAALETVRLGRADAVGSMFRTPEREAVFDFTKPLNEAPTGLFVHQQITGVGRYEDLTGFRVGVVKGDSSEEYLRAKHPDVGLSAYSGVDALVKAAVTGEVKVFVADTPVALYFLARVDGGEVFRLVPMAVEAHAFHAAVCEGNAALLAVLQQGFDQITEREIEEIVSNWGGYSTGFVTPWKWIVFGLAVMGLAGLVVLAWNLRLRRR